MYGSQVHTYHTYLLNYQPSLIVTETKKTTKKTTTTLSTQKIVSIADSPRLMQNSYV